MAIKTARQVAAAKVIYSDIPNSFVAHPVSGDVTRKRNEDSIVQSIRNLLLTDRGERLFQPDVGSDIRAVLFENISPQTELALKQRIENTIEQYEPRCRIVDLIVSGNLDRNEYNVSIFFYTINSEETVRVDIVLDRVR